MTGQLEVTIAILAGALAGAGIDALTAYDR